VTASGDLIRHHAPLSLVQAAACGALGPATSMAMTIHARHCALCAARLSEAEAVGGALLEDQADAPFDVEASLADVLARLDARPVTPSYSPEVLAAPEELRPAFAKALAAGRWSFAGPGLRTLDLDIPGAGRFAEQPQVLKIEPGYGAPRHSHGGMELTLVLDGAFRDETGVYGPGDLAVATDALTHRPIAEPGRTCMAYAVSFAPMRFTGLLGMAQRLWSRRS
jgi:putative transcriptional regulator